MTGEAKEAHASSVPLESRENYKLTKSILLDTLSRLSRPTGSYMAECFHWSKLFVAKVKIPLSRAFSQYGDALFAAQYSQELINTVLGKKTENLVKTISDFKVTHVSDTRPTLILQEVGVHHMSIELTDSRNGYLTMSKVKTRVMRVVRRYRRMTSSQNQEEIESSLASTKLFASFVTNPYTKK